MRTRFVWLAAWIVMACGAETGPDKIPQAPADFRGTITQVSEDGGFLVDDGSATACGFALMYLGSATELWWRVGGRARPDDLRVGRRVSVWQSGEGEARCSTIQAGAVVIEHTRPW